MAVDVKEVKDVKSPEKAPSIVDQVDKQVKSTFEKNVPKKVKKLVKKYNKSVFYSPFQFAIDHVCGESKKWDDIGEDERQQVIGISRAVEEYA